jgi:hypothetical protein
MAVVKKKARKGDGVLFMSEGVFLLGEVSAVNTLGMALRVKIYTTQGDAPEYPLRDGSTTYIIPKQTMSKPIGELSRFSPEFENVEAARDFLLKFKIEEGCQGLRTAPQTQGKGMAMTNQDLANMKSDARVFGFILFSMAPWAVIGFVFSL